MYMYSRRHYVKIGEDDLLQYTINTLSYTFIFLVILIITHTIHNRILLRYIYLANNWFVLDCVCCTLIIVTLKLIDFSDNEV